MRLTTYSLDYFLKLIGSSSEGGENSTSKLKYDIRANRHYLRYKLGSIKYYWIKKNMLRFEYSYNLLSVHINILKRNINLTKDQIALIFPQVQKRYLNEIELMDYGTDHDGGGVSSDDEEACENNRLKV